MFSMLRILPLALPVLIAIIGVSPFSLYQFIASLFCSRAEKISRNNCFPQIVAESCGCADKLNTFYISTKQNNT